MSTKTANGSGRDLKPIEWEPPIPVPEVLESDSAYAWKQFRDAWFEFADKELASRWGSL